MSGPGEVGNRRGAGELASEVLAILQAAGAPLSPADVRERLGGDLAYTTVVTILSRRLVRRDRGEGAFLAQHHEQVRQAPAGRFFSPAHRAAVTATPRQMTGEEVRGDPLSANRFTGASPATAFAAWRPARRSRAAPAALGRPCTGRPQPGADAHRAVTLFCRRVPRR